MIKKKTWKEFQESGLLWWINRQLHLFGWAIVVELDKNNQVSKAYPVRCDFRGFEEESEDEGFVKLTNYIKENIDEILKDLD